MAALPRLPLRPIRRVLLSGLCASALIVGGCGAGDKTVVDEFTVEAASLDLAPADAKTLSRHFTVSPRKGSEADTLAVLDALGLGERTEGRTIDGNTVTYTDWTARQDDSEVSAERVVLRGLHMTPDDQAGIDAIEIDALRAVDPTAQVQARTFVLVGPSPDLAADVTGLLRGDDTLSTSDQVGELTQDMDFRGVHLEDFQTTVTESDQTGTLGISQIVIGNDANDKLADIIVESVDFDWGQGDAPAEERFVLAMDGLSALDIDTEAETPGMSWGLMGSLMSVMSAATPKAKPPYRQVDLGSMTIRSGAFDLDAEGFEADSDTSGETVTLRSVMAPMQLTLKDVSNTPIAPYLDVLRENGLADITLKGSQTTEFDRKADRARVSEARFEVDEGLRVDCDYALRGMGAAARFIEESGVTAPDPTDLDTTEKIDAFLSQMNAYQAVQAEANKEVKIEALDCTVQDVAENSLVTRGYAVAAGATGKPVAVLKGGAKTMIALGSLTAQSEFQRDLMDTLGSGLIDFIDTPGQTMRIRIAPEEPVALTTLQGPDASLKPLGLSVEVQ